MPIYEFTFPYTIDGLPTGAEFECRCFFSATRGTPGRTYGPPEDCYPAEGGTVTEISDIQVEVHLPIVRRESPNDYVPRSKWAMIPADHHLAKVIEEYLWEHTEDLLIAAEEANDYEDARAEAQEDRRNDP